jgi:hypothetical protein
MKMAIFLVRKEFRVRSNLKFSTQCSLLKTSDATVTITVNTQLTVTVYFPRFLNTNFFLLFMFTIYFVLSSLFIVYCFVCYFCFSFTEFIILCLQNVFQNVFFISF